MSSFFRPRPALSIALLIVGLSGGLMAADSASTAASVNLSAVHIDNFGRVNGTYYRGSQPEGGDYATLATLGVKTVINLTSDDADPAERGLVEKAGMHYVQIPMTVHTPPTADQLAQFLDMVNDSASQPVYVHCVGGRHRTGVMTAAYRMTSDGWSADQAFKEMKEYKFGADFLHSEFKTFVYSFHPSAKPTQVAAVPEMVTENALAR
jgi:protein-tyrosine phosphatase